MNTKKEFLAWAAKLLDKDDFKMAGKWAAQNIKNTNRRPISKKGKKD